MKRNGKADLVNGLVVSSISLYSRMAMGDSNAKMDVMSELEGEDIENGAEQPAAEAYAGGKEHGGAVGHEAAIGVVGDQETVWPQAIPSSTVQKLAQSGARSKASPSTKQRSVTRVPAPALALVVIETGAGPPLWIAEEGTEGGPVQLADGPGSISEDAVALRFSEHRQHHIPDPTCRTCHRVATDSGGNSQRNYGGPSCDRNADCHDPIEVGHQ